MGDRGGKILKQLQRKIKNLLPGTVKTESVKTICPGKIYWEFRNEDTGVEMISDYDFSCIGVFQTIDEQGNYVFSRKRFSTYIPLKFITESISDGFIYEVILTDDLLSLLEE